MLVVDSILDDQIINIQIRFNVKLGSHLTRELVYQRNKSISKHDNA